MPAGHAVVERWLRTGDAHGSAPVQQDFAPTPSPPADTAGLVKARVRELSVTAQAIAQRTRALEQRVAPPETLAAAPASPLPEPTLEADVSRQRLFHIHPFSKKASRVFFCHARQLEELRSFLSTGALRSDVLLVTHSSRADPLLMVAALNKSLQTENGACALRCAASWCRGARAGVRDFTLRLASALHAEGLLSPGASLHVFSTDVWSAEAVEDGPAVRDGDESAFLSRLEAALGGREACVGRGTPLTPAFSLLSLDGLATLPYGAWFDARFRHAWRYCREAGEALDDKALDAADCKQSVLTSLLEVPALYAIMVGAFLSIFVPSEGVSCVNFRTDCSFSVRYGLGEAFPKVVLIVNAATASVLLAGNFVAGRREKFLIDNLDVDTAFPKTHLQTVITRYPQIAAGLKYWNLALRRTAFWSLFLMPLNCILSGVYVLRRTFSGESNCCPDITHKAVKTVTVLLSSMLLVLNKIRRDYMVSRESKRDAQGISSMHLAPLNYNQVDHKFIDSAQPVVETASPESSPPAKPFPVPPTPALWSTPSSVATSRAPSPTGRRGRKERV